MDETNKIIIKPYIELKDFGNESIEEYGKLQWNNFKLRQDSPIVDIFFGQFQTKINCPDCNHVSIKCDPFDMIPLNFSSNFYHGDKSFECYMMFDNYKFKTRFVKWKGDFNSSLEMFFKMFIKKIGSELGEKLQYEDFRFFYMSKSKIF